MLTLDLVDRLLVSTLVPRDAKLAAVESWRRELAAMREKPRGLSPVGAAARRGQSTARAPRPWAVLGQYLSGALAAVRAEHGLALRYPRQ